MAGGNGRTPRRGDSHHRGLWNARASGPREDQSASRPSGRHPGGLAGGDVDVPSLPSQANDHPWLGEMWSVRAGHPSASAGA